jgi:hypothetical protein
MKRIFKKKYDLAARNTEARARRPRRQRLAVEALEGRQLLSLGTVEFPVPTTSRNSQFSSDNASAANGTKVVVWTDQFATDHLDNDIRAQMYNADGSKRGGEIIVEFGSLDQEHPHVAMDAVGNFVVTYEEFANGKLGIIAKQYDSNGIEVDNEIGGRINVAVGLLNARDADVAMDASGNFVVSYTQALVDNTSQIVARRFNKLGQQISGFAVTSSSTNSLHPSQSSVAMTPDGRFDIAYQTDGLAHLALYSASGVKQNDVQIFSSMGSIFPTVAMDNAGQAVVAYEGRHPGGTGESFSQFDVEVQRFDTLGNSVGFTIITLDGISGPHPVNNTRPVVTLAPTGGSYAVAWNKDFSSSAGARTVELAEVNSSNVIVGALILPVAVEDVSPALSIAGSGTYLLTYDRFFTNIDRDIDGRFGKLPVAPAAQNLALTPGILAGQSATLTGQLFDGDGDTHLTLTVNWGNGSKPQQSQPGTKPFALVHQYLRPGIYTVHATWTDSTGLSNSRDLTVTVK